MTADGDSLAERLRQVAESQRMDFAQPNVAAMLDDAAEALDGLGALSAERDALQARIDAAPHDPRHCDLIHYPDRRRKGTAACTCWKSAALAGDQPQGVQS